MPRGKNRDKRGRKNRQPSPDPDTDRSSQNDDDTNRSSQNDDPSDSDEYEPITLPSTRVWTPKSIVVLGETLPFVEPGEKAPTGHSEGKVLTAWAVLCICSFASEAVLKLDRDYQDFKRHIEVRCGIKSGVPVTLTNPKRNADAMWHQLFGDERIDTDACGSCRKESGPFASCVQVDGACANCRYNGNAKRCDFHPANIPRSSADVAERKRKSEEVETIEDLLRSIPSKHLKTLEKAIHLARNLD